MDKQKESQAFERFLTQSVDNVGRQRDNALLGQIGSMSHDELDYILHAQPVRRRTPVMTIVRLAAACVAIAVIITIVGHIDFGISTQYGNASLFNTYYREYKVDNAAFNVTGDRINNLGGKNTAAYIEEASILINRKHSKHDLRRGITLLEQLLTYGYEPLLAHEIHWYLGLGYLKDNRMNKAEREFRTVIELEKTQGKSVHCLDAKKIIRQMRK